MITLPDRTWSIPIATLYICDKLWETIEFRDYQSIDGDTSVSHGNIHTTRSKSHSWDPGRSLRLMEATFGTETTTIVSCYKREVLRLLMSFPSVAAQMKLRGDVGIRIRTCHPWDAILCNHYLSQFELGEPKIARAKITAWHKVRSRNIEE